VTEPTPPSTAAIAAKTTADDQLSRKGDFLDSFCKLGDAAKIRGTERLLNNRGAIRSLACR